MGVLISKSKPHTAESSRNLISVHEAHTEAERTRQRFSHEDLKKPNSMNSEKLSKNEDLRSRNSHHGAGSTQNSCESENERPTQGGSELETGITEEQKTRSPSHGNVYKGKGESFSEEERIKNIEESATGNCSDIWNEIDAGLDKWHVINETRPKPLLKGWKVMRVFVSSTFTDFFAEREMLVKRVFPELNEWCHTRKIRLIECDLRWGIPKDTTAESTIEICLNEIERCLDETGGQAFFINLLGERYGWIPDLRQLSKDTIERFDLIEGASVTLTEILHAAIRSASQNALFLIRKPGFIAYIPKGLEPSFLEQSDVGKERLKELKTQLKRRFPTQVFEYDCQYDGVVENAGLIKVKIAGLQAFADNVTEFFKNAVDKFYPQDDIDLTTDEWNFIFQDIFIEKKCPLLVGRGAEMKKLEEFISSEQEDSKNYLLVTGPPGIGKSSLLANGVRYMKSSQICCLYNFASGSPGSTISSLVSEIFTRRLMSMLGLAVDDYESLSYEGKIKRFQEVIKMIIDQKRHFVFVFDAVNQFSDNHSFFNNWLPTELQGNVKCVIGCTDGPVLDSIKEKFSDISYDEIGLKGFDVKASEDYVVSVLSRYNKKLDECQLSSLVSKNEACNPFWLALACEELRIFGVFESLTEKIRDLPGRLEELIGKIIQRLVTEDETGKLKETVCMLVCSLSGLTETELRWSSGNGDEPLPLMIWKKCRLLLQPYLLTVGKRRAEENLAFCHDSFNIAVRKILLSDESNKQLYHSRLASAFSLHCEDDSRVAEELPRQLKLANRFKELIEFFRNDRRSMRVTTLQKSFFLKEFRCRTFVRGENDKFCFPVYICNTCSTRSKAFTPVPGLNKDTCLICGGHVAFKKNKAYVCMKHKEMTSPGTTKCWICKQIVFLNKGFRENQLYLCQHCSSQGQKCVKLEC